LLHLLQVYRVTVEPLVHTLFNNGKATCFAYGQTGSGKTFTMSPLPIRAAADILRYLERPELRDVELYVSCFEIYGNKVFDLLNMRKKLNILEDGKKKVCVVGLKVSTGLMLMIALGHNLGAASAPCAVHMAGR
jgi:kinesin family protein 2/24